MTVSNKTKSSIKPAVNKPVDKQEKSVGCGGRNYVRMIKSLA